MPSDSATLGLPNTRELAVDATHAELAKIPSPDDGTYLLIRDVLTRVIDKVLPKYEPGLLPPPTTPPMDPGTVSDQPRRIDFPAYVYLLKEDGASAEGGLHAISDIQDKGPSALLQLQVQVHGDAQAAEAALERPPSKLLWVHIPLNNTVWVNVCEPLQTSSLYGAIANGEVLPCAIALSQ